MKQRALLSTVWRAALVVPLTAAGLALTAAPASAHHGGNNTIIGNDNILIDIDRYDDYDNGGNGLGGILDLDLGLL